MILPHSRVGPVLLRLHAGEYTLLYAQSLLEELVDVLNRPCIRHEYRLTDADIETLVSLILLHGEAVAPGSASPSAVTPKVTGFWRWPWPGGRMPSSGGTKTCWRWHPFEGISILTPADFLQMSEDIDIMKVSSVVIGLSSLVAVLALIAAAIGLFWKDRGTPFPFTTLHGQTAQIYGQGLYRFDTLFIGAGYKGQDAVALFIGIPLLVTSIVLYRRGTVSGQLLLTGTLGYFLYLYASMALGAAYNRLFLVYIVLFSASLFAFVQVFSSVDLASVASQISAGLPRRGLAIFMFAAGFVTLVVWCAPLVVALIRGGPPDRMDSYTTMVTYALDLAIITPATFLCAILILRSNPLGYVIASPLLTLIVLLSPQIILSTLFQRSAGVPFTTGEMVGPVAGFVVLGLVAAWLLIALLRGA
ncbi:MAG: hypothetical protein Kow0063_16710 [Anaerolineae bacterium]